MRRRAGVLIPAGTPSLVDVIDRIDRLLGHVSVNSGVEDKLLGVYSFVLPNFVPGTSAAYNLLALFNPAASGIVLHVLRVIFDQWPAAGVAPTTEQVATRITASSGGTLQAAAAICKHQSSFPNPGATVRTNNPAVTLGAEFLPLNATPQSVAGGASVTPNFWAPRFDPEELVLVEGEGLVLRRPIIGDADQRFGPGITWLERTP